ncbi:molybdopterin oxidoreductase family protein [Mycobacterium xenopi 3993]|nr:molybdopterin oxidoreductase family protein [Mycobacterium xenopi 3993]
MIRRGVPVLRLGEKLVTTVFDLLMAHYAVSRPGLPGEWPPATTTRRNRIPLPGSRRSRRCRPPRRPGWPRIRPQRRAFQRPVDDRDGCGHQPLVPLRPDLPHVLHAHDAVRLPGVNGGGWAHYVGQEKVRPLTGWQQVAFALDWQRPTRQMTGTSFFYLHTDQWRYEQFGADELASPLGRGLFRGKAMADALAQSARLGWAPSFPTFDRNPLDLADAAAAAGKSVADYVIDELRSGRMCFAGEDPDNPVNFPRVLTVWRANLLGSSGKGMEYFMRHLLGTHNAVRANETPEALRPAEVRWRDEARKASSIWRWPSTFG